MDQGWSYGILLQINALAFLSLEPLKYVLLLLISRLGYSWFFVLP